jgi:hypothetical protein
LHPPVASNQQDQPARVTGRIDRTDQGDRSASRGQLLSLLAKRTTGDLLRSAGSRRVADPPIATGSLEAAIAWLVRTHEQTGHRGSSKGVNLIRGWLPAFPETTGYVIGTLLTYANRYGKPDLVEHAIAMGDWEIEVQCPDGGVMQGLITETPKSIAFNTGMVLHGWLDLHEQLGEQRHLEAAQRAGESLTSTLDADGAWRGDAAYLGIATTYHSRVAWALLRLGIQLDDESIREHAISNLEWTLRQQQTNGWFANCAFKTGATPNTHSIAYTLRGLLEAGILLGDDRYIDAVSRTSAQLVEQLEEIGTLPARFDSDWRPRAWFLCLTGLVQLGDVLLKLATVTGDDRTRAAGARLVRQGAARQERAPGPVTGALPGSFPIFGLYAPMQYLNWATKFLADALMTLEQEDNR